MLKSMNESPNHNANNPPRLDMYITRSIFASHTYSTIDEYLYLIVNDESEFK